MTDRETAILAWWFAPPQNALQRHDALAHGDDRPVTIGETHEIEGELVLCENGLHASISPLDALDYAHSCIMYRVEIYDPIVGSDKVCGRWRKYLARIDAEEILRRFARECALSVTHIWDAPEVVKKYLETGDESLRQEAASAARAAWAAWDARDARAAWAATAASTTSSARAARAASAASTAWDAKPAAAFQKQSARLEEMLLAEMEKIND